MATLHLAIIGFGKLGKACAKAILKDSSIVLEGVVRRAERVSQPLPAPFADIPAVSHIRELKRVDAALVCVPTEYVLGVVHDLLQQGVAIVECATLHGKAFEEHLHEIDRIASRHKVPAVVGAGWDPGALSMIRGIFALLTPKGHTEMRRHPGINLHHTTVARTIDGVREALSIELHTTTGALQRYVYVELEEGAELTKVEEALKSDPLFLDVETWVFPVESVKLLEEEGHGVVMERRGEAAAAAHQMLLFEARFSELALCAQVMLAAARAISSRGKRAYSLFDLPLGALWGEIRELEKEEWI